MPHLIDPGPGTGDTIADSIPVESSWAARAHRQSADRDSRSLVVGVARIRGWITPRDHWRKKASSLSAVPALLGSSNCTISRQIHRQALRISGRRDHEGSDL